MPYQIYQCKNAQEFTELLPADWSADLIPYLDQNFEQSKIYLLSVKNETIGGGVIFSKCSPDLYYNPQEAATWFEKGYLYIGYLWLKDSYRAKGGGSAWLQHILKKYPTQKFFLTIDDKQLLSFYEKNGFHFIKTLQNGEATEWLLSFERSKAV